MYTLLYTKNFNNDLKLELSCLIINLKENLRKMITSSEKQKYWNLSIVSTKNLSKYILKHNIPTNAHEVYLFNHYKEIVQNEINNQ